MPRKLDNDQIDREVLFILSRCVGKENAIDRWLMVFDVFGERVLPTQQNDDNPLDRAIRYSINRLRKKGHLICDLGDGKGRYIAANEAEFWEQYRYYASPIKERAEVLSAMKKAAQAKWPNVMQPTLFDSFSEASA